MQKYKSSDVVTAFFEDQDPLIFEAGIRASRYGWEKYVDLNQDYVEK